MKILPIPNFGIQNKNSSTANTTSTIAAQKNPQFTNYDFKQYAISFKGNKENDDKESLPEKSADSTDVEKFTKMVLECSGKIIAGVEDAETMQDAMVNSIIANLELSAQMSQIMLARYGKDIPNFAEINLEESAKIAWDSYMPPELVTKLAQSDAYKTAMQKVQDLTNAMLGKMFSLNFKGSKGDIEEHLMEIMAPGAVFTNETLCEDGVRVKEYTNALAKQKTYREEDKDGNLRRVGTSNIGLDGKEGMGPVAYLKPNGRLEKYVTYNKGMITSEFLFPDTGNVVIYKQYKLDGSLKLEKTFEYKDDKFILLGEKRD